MKWFLVIVVVLNVLVGLYGVLKQKPVADIGAQDINAAQLTILPASWSPASAPLAQPEASAVTALTDNLDASVATPAAALPATLASQPSVQKPAMQKPLMQKPLMQKPVAPLKADTPTVAKAELTPVAKPAAAGQCLAWGALDDKQLARVQGGLPALKLAAAPQSSVKEAMRGSGRVWVFYPPLATKAETQTLVAELKGKGFDSYIVKTEGEFSGHLSLGLFSKEAAAQALVARLKAAGYDKAKVDARSERSQLTTLSFRALDAAQADKLRALQQRLLPGIPLRACS
ncbi:SPOR domain-containing protein [Vogesella sp. LYT5W]|uniref:SPOR domain-containing protein n=1 Tax=Vogesella margarita TaxID=2984199 RepID=A0ABT5IRT3_9NEIS|nr:SPOR domain-containing protein [Vogesella margarita]MDC7715267.1 SPOR domain-containing protein [Vogesella margarita]